MATRQRMTAEERRKQILRSAIRVFARSSYHGATTKMISREAGIAEALIYRYFGSKRGLFTEAVNHTGERLIGAIRGVLDKHPDDPAAALAGLLMYYLEILNRHEEFAKMIFHVSAELDDPEVAEVYLPYQEEALVMLQESIERWQRSGALRSELPVRGVAWLLLGSYQLLALMKHSGQLKEVDSRAVLALAKPYFLGLELGPQSESDD